MNKLLTIGDSFTYGEELADRNLAWPTILANKLGYKLTNLGKPGSGNTRMIRKALMHSCSFDLVVIAWSHYARIEMADEYGVYDIWPGSNEHVHNNLPHRQQLIRYITKYHNDVYDLEQYLIDIILLQNFFNQNNIKYIMVNSFGNNYKELENCGDLKELEKQIQKTNFLGWSNNNAPFENMMDWTYGSPKGPQGHFLEQGHEQVADKIYEYIRHLGWVS